MDLACTVNYGRTLQEPMWRLRLRDHMLEIFEDYLALLARVHELAEENLETIMVGQTHMNHGQPITYAHFLVSVFDGIYRGLEQFELAYRYTNKNTGGCGSCSGTTWPVDRRLMAELLGMDGVVEPTFDCESSQDHSLAILFALSNTAVHVSRYAMNHYIWSVDEIDMMRSDLSLCGVSSFMPQKCDAGTIYEKVRMYAGRDHGRSQQGHDGAARRAAHGHADGAARPGLRVFRHVLGAQVLPPLQVLPGSPGSAEGAHARDRPGRLQLRHRAGRAHGARARLRRTPGAQHRGHHDPPGASAWIEGARVHGRDA